MFWNAAQYAAAEHNQDSVKAWDEKMEMWENYENLIDSGEISRDLATNLKEMGWNGGLWAVNLEAGNEREAHRALDRSEKYYRNTY